MNKQGVSNAAAKVEGADPGTVGWQRWRAWLDQWLPSSWTAPKASESRGTGPPPRRCVRGTVASLQGRFPSGSRCFRLERIGLIDERKATLISLPVLETAQIPSSLCLGLQVSATLRDGAVLSLMRTRTKVPARRGRKERRDVAVG